MDDDIRSLTTRNRIRSAAVFCVALVGSAPATAQGMTWIVDQSGGPGTHFLDLPPAVKVASDGDTVIIRPGGYTGISTGKALTLLGEGSVTVLAAWPKGGVLLAPHTLEVVGLVEGKTFVMKNLTIAAYFFNTRVIHLHDNNGRIHLEMVRCTVPLEATATALHIANCREVTVSGGNLTGGIGLRATGSTVSLSSVTVTGANAVPRLGLCYQALPGIISVDSTVYLSRTDVQGGHGRWGGFLFMGCSGQPAIRMNGGTTTVTGDSNTTLTAGSWRDPVPAIIAASGLLVVDTGVTLLPWMGSPAIQSTGTVTRRRVVSLTARGAAPGGVVTAEVVSPAGDPPIDSESELTRPTLSSRQCGEKKLSRTRPLQN